MGVFSLGKNVSLDNKGVDSGDSAPVNKHWVCARNGRDFLFFLLVKGNAYRLLLMADERSSKEGGEKKNQVEALTEVQLAVSNYRRADAFCTVNREETQSRDFHTHIGRFQLTALVLERCELYTKARRARRSGGRTGVWTVAMGAGRFRATQQFLRCWWQSGRRTALGIIEMSLTEDLRL